MVHTVKRRDTVKRCIQSTYSQTVGQGFKYQNLFFHQHQTKYYWSTNLLTYWNLVSKVPPEIKKSTSLENSRQLVNREVVNLIWMHLTLESRSQSSKLRVVRVFNFLEWKSFGVIHQESLQNLLDRKITRV